MLNVKSLPDQIHLRTYPIEPDAETGAIADFEAGQLVELAETTTYEEDTYGTPLAINEMSGVATTRPYPIFRDTENRWDQVAFDVATVVKREHEAVTDQFADALVGAGEGTNLTAEDGVWREAASGETVWAEVVVGPDATSANGGTLQYRYISAYILP